MNGIGKLSAVEKKHLLIQCNNTKKNILYRRNEKREAIPYLMDQLEIIGGNEAVFGVSLVHIYQDLAYIYFELQEWDHSLHYYKELQGAAMKTAARTHSANETMHMA